MNLTEWVRTQGIHPQAAFRWYREGTPPVPVQKVGRLILVSPQTVTKARKSEGAGLYARVSSHDPKPDLDGRVARLSAPLGSAALARPHTPAPPDTHRPPRGSAGDRQTRTRSPGPPTCAREPARTRGCGCARNGKVNPGTPRDHPKTGTTTRKPATWMDPRQPPGIKTRRPRQTTAGDQAAQDRPGPPT